MPQPLAFSTFAHSFRNIMELTLKIFQFIFSISILVVLHELGHFLPAKWFKTKVEKFYLFFDPWFSVVKKKIGETEYGIGWLPFGGYVKIAGMIDESMDTEQMKKPAELWEFRSKKAWQRLIIMLGGVIVNFLLAWIIYGMLSYNNGEEVYQADKLISSVHYSDVAKKMGFQDGDKILKVDGKIQKDFRKLSLDVLLSDRITVERNGKEVTFDTDDEGKKMAFQTEVPKAFLVPRIDASIGKIGYASAKEAGLKEGDKILKINEKSIQFFDEIAPAVTLLKGKKAKVEILRNDVVQTLEIPIDESGKMGIAPKMMEDFMTTHQYSFGEAIGRGFTRSIESLTYQVKQFKLIFNRKVQGYKKVGGPLAIINQMPVEKSEKGDFSINWTDFWQFTAMFSVWLAFLNLLPIPGLDGGHVMFTLWEMITGKPVPQNILEKAQMIGVIFLLGLMILIFGNDIWKLVIEKL